VSCTQRTWENSGFFCVNFPRFQAQVSACPVPLER
jgi:hypothetical protein